MAGLSARTGPVRPAETIKVRTAAVKMRIAKMQTVKVPVRRRAVQIRIRIRRIIHRALIPLMRTEGIPHSGAVARISRILRAVQGPQAEAIQADRTARAIPMYMEMAADMADMIIIIPQGNKT